MSIHIATKLIHYELIKRLRNAEKDKLRMIEKGATAPGQEDGERIRNLEAYMLELRRQIQEL